MTHSNERPKKIDRLGFSTFAYNYDVQEVSVQTNENETARTEYQFKTLIFDHVPTSSEVINRIVTDKYKDGEELAIQRKAILNPELPEFIEYNNFVENVKKKVKMEYEEI